MTPPANQSRAVHHVTCEDKKREGQERELGDVGVDVGGGALDAELIFPEKNQGRPPHRREDRRAQDQQDEEHREEQQSWLDHLTVRAARRAPCTIRHSTTTPMTGMPAVYHHCGMARASDVVPRARSLPICRTPK